MKELKLPSPAFQEGGPIPLKHTGYDEDISPEFKLDGLQEGAVSLATTMNDIDHLIPAYNHWVIRNLPVITVIPENIPRGPQLESLRNAMQGRGYGKNRYCDLKPPFHWSHRYSYHVYALDCLLDLPSTAGKRGLLSAMEGHILQRAVLIGHHR